MFIRDGNGNELQLKIIDYESPDFPVESNPWDLNWLLIGIFIKTPLGHAKFSDAALLTWEVSRLIDWLRLLAVQRQVNNSIYFIENTLSFELISYEGNKTTLRFYFCLDKNESWIPINDSVERPDGCDAIDFVLSSDDVLKTALELTDQLAQYPLRE